jgi:hypothetical protein
MLRLEAISEVIDLLSFGLGVLAVLVSMAICLVLMMVWISASARGCAQEERELYPVEGTIFEVDASKDGQEHPFERPADPE